MKLWLGLFIILFGIFLGLYLGIWVCFIGGIVGVVTAFTADVFPILGFAISVTKIVCAGFIGWLSFLLCTLVGAGLIATGE